MPPITIIIPAYNEEASVEQAIDEMRRIKQRLEAEVIVVDDGPTDATAALVKQHLDTVNLARHETNRGYGAALKTGITEASHSIICITDADGTYPSHYIVELVEELEQNAWRMVVGARTGEEVRIPLIRRPAKWMIGQLANAIAGRQIPDINSGLRVFYRKDAMQFLRILPDGFSFTTTITLGMLTNNYLVGYVPINYRKRVGKSKIKPIRDTLNFIRLIIRIGLYFAPLRVFLPAGIALIVLSMIWAVLSITVFGQLADVSTVVIFMSGLQICALGLLAEVINFRMPSNYYHD